MLLPLLVACGGPDEETLVDELRVMAVVAEPPELAPGASTTLTATVADPAGVDPDVLIWTCTSLGEGCLEAALPGGGATAGRLSDGQLSTPRTAPVELAGVVGDGETVLPIPTWTLACAPGLCPVIDLAAAAPAPGSTDALALDALLADPFTMLTDLPLVDVSLAFTTIGVSTRATPVSNPTLSPTFTEVSAAPEASTLLGFDVVGGAEAFGYASAGGFGMSPEIVDGHVDLEWFAPADGSAGDVADLWVTVNGADGGSALWRGTATVE